MKTVGSIIISVLFAFVMLYGMVLIFNQAGANNALDSESITLISQYDNELGILQGNITSNYQANKDLIDYDPDANDVGTEAKEFFETKDKVNQLKSTVKLATKLPDIFFLSIPFVDEDDLTIYKTVTGLLLVITLFVAFIMAIFGKFWGDNN